MSGQLAPGTEPLVRRTPWWRRAVRSDPVPAVLVGMALIPEAIAFSLIAGVDPRVGLIGTSVLALVVVALGSRPALVTGATAAVALVLAPLGHEHGSQAVLAAVVLAGLLQVVLALLGIDRLIRRIPPVVTTGLVNAVAVLIVLHQVRHLIDVPGVVYLLTLLAVGLLLLVARLAPEVPAALIAVVVVTFVAMVSGRSVPDVGDLGALPDGLPSLVPPDLPLTSETVLMLAPYAVAAAVVGLVEQHRVGAAYDRVTRNLPIPRQDGAAQGAANVVAGLFGGLGGSATAAQPATRGARTRLAPVVVAVVVLGMVISFAEIVALIPTAALVAVMVLVAAGMGNWALLRPDRLRAAPRSQTAVLLGTLVVTVATQNPALGLLGGLGVHGAIAALRPTPAR